MEKVRLFHQRFATELKRLRSVFANFRDVEEQVFLDIVKNNTHTAFGREHGFSAIKSRDDYRRAVPIQGYDGFEPWIERIAVGEKNVLTNEPVILFRRTSGTSGASKKIPVTTSSLEVDAAAFHVAHGQTFARCPEAYEHADGTMNMALNLRLNAHSTTETPSGIKWQALSDHLAQLSGLGQPMCGILGTAAPWFDTGEPLSTADLAYFRLRLSVEADLRGIMAANPSSIVQFGHLLAQELPHLVEELRAGTVRGKPVRAPNPERARALEALAARGKVKLRDIWPNLKFVQTWKSAACALYLPQVTDQVGSHVEIIPFCYTCSEGIGQILLDHHPTAGFFLPDGAVREFVPASEDVRPDSQTLESHELEVDKEYHLIHTGLNGLYRYAIGDLFRVLERVDGIPRLEFVGRKGAFSSFTGEKLTERQVMSAALEAWKRLGLQVNNFTCCPVWGEPPYYAFVIECGSPDRDVAEIAKELDAQLIAHNDEYPSKRSSGRLRPVTVHLVKPGTFARYRVELLDAGKAVAGQIKDKPLQKDDAPRQRLLALGAMT